MSQVPSIRSSQSAELPLLKQMVGSTPASIAILDRDLRYIAVSDRWKASYNIQDDIAGRSHLEIFPDSSEDWKQIYSRSLAGESARRDHDVIVHSNGSRQHLRWEIQPWRESAGVVGGIILFREDITERVIAEQNFRRETEVLDAIIKSTSSLAANLNLEKIVQEVTEAATQLSGAQFGAFFYNVIDDKGESYTLYTIAGVPREHFSKFPMPRNTAVFEPTFRGMGTVRSGNIMKDPRYGKNDPHFGMPKGHLPVCSYLAVPVISRSGEVFGGLFFGHSEPDQFTETSERLVEAIARQAGIAIENSRLFESEHRARARAEKTTHEISRAEERLKLITTSVDVGTWYCDLPFDKLQWSPKTKEHFWLPENAEVTIHTFYERIHPEDRERTSKAIDESIATHSTYDIDYRTISSQGEIKWIRAIGRGFYDEHGNPTRFDGITVDQTARKAAEEVLRRTERLATAGRLAATVAHEVNNPLESVTNLIFICQNEPDLNDNLRRYLKMADEELSRVAHIVRQTLGFYRDDSAPQVTDLSVLASDLIQFYRRRFQSKQVELLSHLEPNVVATVVAGEIRQVIANLLTNALDASSIGGKVSISVKKQGDHAGIEVKDSGHGISEDNRKKLFEPFFTTKHEVGTGLGLWVSKSIVEKHKGTIQVESSTKPSTQGTAFKIELPQIDVSNP
jgi:PAS domain S-box-containing protein